MGIVYQGLTDYPTQCFFNLIAVACFYLLLSEIKDQLFQEIMVYVPCQIGKLDRSSNSN